MLGSFENLISLAYDVDIGVDVGVGYTVVYVHPDDIRTLLQAGEDDEAVVVVDDDDQHDVSYLY